MKSPGLPEGGGAALLATLPSEFPSTPRSYSALLPPDTANNLMEEERLYSTRPPSRKWSCLESDHRSATQPINPAALYKRPPAAAASGPVVSSSSCAEGGGDSLPVERWAQNVSRYYGSHNAPETGGGACAQPPPAEELSELDSLYRASLLAPGVHGSAPSHKAGPRRIPSGLRRSKTPTAEMERHAYRTPVMLAPKCPDGADESYSAENLRRITRNLNTNLGPARGPVSVSSRSPSSSTLPRPLTTSSSSIAAPSSSSRHGVQSPLAPPPSSRPPGSGPPGPGWRFHGDEGEAVVLHERHSGVPLTYGTLPRAPRRSSASSSLLLSGQRGGAAAAPHSLYATLSRPGRLTSFAPQPRASPGAGGGGGGVARPLRLDVPPDGDWRRGGAGAERNPAGLLRLTARTICSLCRQLPADSPHPFCSPCGAHVARRHPPP
ncbi:inactive ubiquitin carboxyl-terminal hydrolase 54-like [Hippocampus comes]|uniref:inactive ubiquitin carboxyl-terminal hydrolase 54-like n=1 Tax=Hippocampus comes TaxID=109280 RepID=UPI00094ECBFA|nr:PREDICTED: inactive ubiquitin carboxyl-terminal hydrolase 54-like [Hippocampus comes]